MSLEYRQYSDGSGPEPTTTDCPFCSTEIGKHQSLARHLRHACEEKS